MSEISTVLARVHANLKSFSNAVHCISHGVSVHQRTQIKIMCKMYELREQIQWAPEISLLVIRS